MGYKPLIHAVQSHLELLNKAANPGMKSAVSTSSLPAHIEPTKAAGHIIPADPAPTVASDIVEKIEVKSVVRKMPVISKSQHNFASWTELNNNSRSASIENRHDDEHCVVSVSSPEQSQCCLM